MLDVLFYSLSTEVVRPYYASGKVGEWVTLYLSKKEYLSGSSPHSGLDE